MDLLKKALQTTKQQRESLLLGRNHASQNSQQQQQNDSVSNDNQQNNNQNNNQQNNNSKKRKWVKRGDLEAERERQYLEEMKAAKRLKQSLTLSSTSASTSSSSTNQKNKNNFSATNKNSAKNQDQDHDMMIEVDLTNILPRDLVIKSLREYGQPITLFGEDDVARYKRLRIFEITTHDDQLLRLKHQNDFAQHLRRQQQEQLEADKASMLGHHRDDQPSSSSSSTDTKKFLSTNENGNVVDGDDDEISSSSSTTTTNSSNIQQQITTDHTTKLSITDENRTNNHHHHDHEGENDDDDDHKGKQQKEMLTSASEPLQTEPRIGQSDCDYVRSFLRRLLKQWETYLSSERTEEEKRSTQGRIEASIFQQSKDHIRPLLKLLKNQSLQTDILQPLKRICMYMAKREYVLAHGVYLELSIGNAPWPMGVTMVGIHERKARQRIETGQIAHILNDEQQRKYIQSVKRLISFCQKKYPTDPSRMVL